MNDKIKEKKTKRIIEKIEGLATYVTIPRELAIYNVNIDSQEAKLLIDYITNLQEQLHQASLDIQELTERDIECPSWCDKLTNLQQENQELNDSITWWNNRFNAVQRDYEKLKEENTLLKHNCKQAQRREKQLENYKSRIEKAVEYIKKEVIPYGNEWHWDEGGIRYYVEEALNILEGKSDE